LSPGFGGATNMTLLGTSSNCTTKFGYFPDANRILCDECDPNRDDSGPGVFCSPANFDGGFLKDKNYCYFPCSTRSSALPDNNTLGVDLSLEENYPTEEQLFPGSGLNWAKGLANGPLLAWGAATGSTVSFEVKAPNGIGLNSYMQSPPSGRCINAQVNDAGPLVGYFMNTSVEFVYAQDTATQKVETSECGVVRFTQTD
jgi:hypothetical protein